MNWALRQSLTQESISWRERFSVVTFVEYTLTAIISSERKKKENNKNKRKKNKKEMTQIFTEWSKYLINWLMYKRRNELSYRERDVKSILSCSLRGNLRKIDKRKITKVNWLKINRQEEEWKSVENIFEISSSYFNATSQSRF